MAEWWRDTVERIRQTDPMRARELERRYRAGDRRDAQQQARLDAMKAARQSGNVEVARIWGDALAMDECPMRAPTVRGTTEGQCAALRVCYLCGTDLPDGKRRWCSRACDDAWWQNHAWNMARGAAVRRDHKTCQRCGKREGDVLSPGECRVDGEAWPCSVAREAGPTGRTWPHWSTGTVAVTLEVNHREPLVGRGYAAGCVHHAENLETLCHACHTQETTRQGRERRNGRAPEEQIAIPA